uniref:Ig-like domain-containing protein n=1 Tax=Pygocentrus nattereri TaxID=42514 RepID=A0A3B4CK81_PYGNA
VHSSDNKTEYSFSVVESDSGKYTCRGERRSDSQRSEISDAVTLIVSALPRATLTVEPESSVFTGESVTLKCEIKGYVGWTYQWYKQAPWGGWTAVSQSVYHTVNRDTLTIRADTVINGDQYWCRGERHDRPTSSQNSSSVTLTVNEKPKPELTSSHKGAALIGNPVVLYCELDQSAGWRFYWSKHTQSPENETKPETHSYTISSVSVSDGGQYWCRAGRGTPVYYTHYSDALWINTTGE